MEIIGLTFGFFLSNRIENPHKFFYDLNKKIGIELIETFSMPSLPKDKKIGQFDDLPLLNASSKNLYLSIMSKKILVYFDSKGKKDINKFLKSIEPVINKIKNFIRANNKIRRIGIISKFFLVQKNEMNYLERFINKNKFPNRSFRDISININWENKINKIPTNNIFNILKAIQEKKGKKIKGLQINIDINNLNNRNLKVNEVEPFFESLKQEIIKISGENLNG